jgi:folate-dependent phosphoribosylglycinamide formyltransferase PurN
MLNAHGPAEAVHYSRPLRVAIVCSHRAPGLLHLLTRSPERGVTFEVVCAISSERTFDEEIIVERRGIRARPHPIADFYAERGAHVCRDNSVRQSYDAETVALLAPYQPDVLVLDGYRYLVTAPLLEAYRNRILNLHFSDLALRTPRGGPLYAGIRAVRQAVNDGCPDTRACVHLVNEEPDGGAVLVRSWPFPVSPMIEELRSAAHDAVNAYAFAHERWMMRAASGPLLEAALRLVATGAVDLDSLAVATAASSSPWLLSQHGFLMAPELEAV